MRTLSGPLLVLFGMLLWAVALIGAAFAAPGTAAPRLALAVAPAMLVGLCCLFVGGRR